VRDRIIVHLAPYSRYSEEFECPEAMSQAGISLAIGKSRAHTTLELNRMKESELVVERLAHVKGTKSRRKTYSLSNPAQSTERQIVAHLEDLEVDVAGAERLNGKQAADLLTKESSIPRAMAFDIVLSSGGRIDPEEHKPRSATAPVETDITDPETSTSSIQMETGTFDAQLLQANTLHKKGNSKEALDILDKVFETELSASEMSKAHYTRATIFRKQGNYTVALDEINRSLKAAEDSGQPLLVGRSQMEKAITLSQSGEVAEILGLLDSAEVTFRIENSQIDILRCGINQGFILRNIGNIDEAASVLEDSLDEAERTQQHRFMAYALANLTDLLNEQKEYARSIELSSRAKDIFQVLDEPLMFAISLFNLGEAQAALGNKEEAIKNLDKAISLLEEKEISRPGWLQQYAVILIQLGEPEKARSILDNI